MRLFYHAASNRFFSERLHGAKLILVDHDEGEALKWADNPDCEIPADAAEITADQFIAAQAAWSAGLDVVAGDDGLPAFTRPKVFYDPASKGFYNEDVHGSKRLPTWASDHARWGGETPEWQPNPGCGIPDSALEITPEQHAELLEAQSTGLAIAPDADGFPAAVPHVQDEAERVAMRRHDRQRRLTASDWTQLPDVLADKPELKAAWATYRQQLRDLDMAGNDWPTAPDAG